MIKKIKLTAEKKYELLREISNKMRDTLELDVILNNLLDTLKNIIEHDAAGIFVLSQDIIHPRYHFPRQLIGGIAIRGYDNRPPEQDEMLSSGKGIIGYVIRTGESVIIPDVRLDSRYVVGRERTLSEIAVPIMKDNRAIGALDVESDKIGAFDRNDLEIMSFFADAASISIEKAMLHHQILEKKKMEKQLQIASEVQSRLLPHDSPKIKGYDFAGLCIPTYEIGGDYFDYISINQDKTGIAVADVSGDGIPAALIMTAFRALLRSQAKKYSKPSVLMKSLNKQLSEFTRRSDFITSFYGILDSRNHNFIYSNCGHNPPLVFRNDGKIEKLSAGGPSLCLIKEANYKSRSVKLAPGEQIVFYTDGVIEIFDSKGEEFGLDRLINAIVPCRDLPADKLLERIVEKTKNFSQSEIYKDDYTLVIVKHNYKNKLHAFLRNSKQKSSKEQIEIIDYKKKLKVYFKRLNSEWLRKFFTVEQKDEQILNNPEKYIIDKGGFVIFAKVKNTVCGTTAMIKHNNELYELSKMAVSEKYQGMKIGEKLALAAIEKAKNAGAKKIILETNWKLNKAVNLYKKLGFSELRGNPDIRIHYKRPTFLMELDLLDN